MEILSFIAGLKGLNCSSTFQKLWCDFLQLCAHSDDSQRLFRLLMRCTFEAQSEDLIQLFYDSIQSCGSTKLALKHFKLGCQDLGMLGRILASFTKGLLTSKSCPSGLTLILDSTRLLRSDIEALGNLISKTDALIHISMNECGLDDRDIEVIGEAWATNSSLELLKVARNQSSSVGLARISSLIKQLVC